MPAPFRRAAAALAALGILLGASCASPALPVDGERALQRVREQVAMGPRIPGTPAHEAIRTWIARAVESTGGRLEDQAYLDSSLGRPLMVHNLIARYGPATGRRIALLAHYDTRPWCDEDPDTSFHATPMPGANDAGSGVAVLLEAAEAMKRSAPPVGVDLVFLDVEDMGTKARPEDFCIGAKGYAARLPAPGDPARPVAAFLFDMVGDRDLGIWTERNSAERAANLTALVDEAARATGARHFHRDVRWTLIDDHVPLLDAGLPTVDLIDFDYPAWHTHRDLPAEVSAASLAEVSRVALWLVYRSPLARP